MGFMRFDIVYQAKIVQYLIKGIMFSFTLLLTTVVKTPGVHIQALPQIPSSGYHVCVCVCVCTCRYVHIYIYIHIYYINPALQPNTAGFGSRF